MIKLKYRGKKINRTLDIPQLSQPIRLQNDPIVVSKADAKWLTENNPNMFHNLGVYDPAEVVEPVDPPPAEPERPTYTCDKCDKVYKIEKFYLDHIETCTGPED